MLPSPKAGSLLALDKLSVDLLGIHKGDVTVIDLGRLVQNLKDTRCARHRHDDGVDLLGHLAYVIGKLTAHVQKRQNDRQGHHATDDREVRHLPNHQKAAKENQGHVQKVSDVAHDRHQDIGKEVRLGRILAMLLVDAVKILSALLFVAENLDDLLAVHHFLHKALGLGDRLLHGHKVLSTIAADKPCDKEHRHNAKQDDQRHPNAHIYHAANKEGNDQRRLHQVRQGVGYQLAERIDVVGVIGHNITVLVGIKVTKRKGLHLGKHLSAHLVQKSLRNHGHKAGIEEVCAKS